MIERPLVSVIIPTRNSAKFLKACLESLRAQKYKNIEIIVVDNNSTDETKEIARKYADKVLNKGPERSAQVNQGVKVAKGKYVYRVDSDFIVEPSVIEEAVSKCESEGYDGVVIHNTSDPTISFWSRVRKLERDCYENDNLNIAVRFVRKDVFETLGGFDESLVAAEDYDFHNRFVASGFRFGRISAKEIHIGEPRSLWEIVRKYYYYGQTIGRWINKDPVRAVRQLNPVRTSFIRQWRVFAAHPILTIGFVIYQTVRYAAAIAGYITSQMTRKLGRRYHVQSA